MDYRQRPLGAIPSPQDPRDYTVAMIAKAPAQIPESFCLPNLPEIYDQNGYGMCCAFATASIKEWQEYKERGARVRYSPGFIYANRKDGDYTGEGMQPREGLKNLCSDGVCSFDDMPTMGDYPTCYAYLSQHPEVRPKATPQKIASYVRAYTDAEIKTAIMATGPVLVVIAVYDSFYQAGADGVVPPVGLNESIKGYHAMYIVGWRKNDWITPNSWGKTWGDNGKCYLPFGYKGITEVWGITDYIAPVKSVQMDAPATIIPPGRFAIPVRFVAEALGGSAVWDAPTETATMTIPPQTKTVTMQVKKGSSIMKIWA